MAYIGNSPANVGNYQIIDDIKSQFDGTTTSFQLQVATHNITPAKSGQLLVSINGVLQEPDDTGTQGFTISGTNIVFSSAPNTGAEFWGVYQGQNVDIGTPSLDTVDTVHIKDDAITDVKINSTKLDGISDNANNYSHPSAHTVSEVTGLQSALDGKIDDSQVLTNVPSGALFTDTIYTHPSTHTIAETSGLQSALDDINTIINNLYINMDGGGANTQFTTTDVSYDGGNA